jgi:lysophospholipase L1-like esterase
VATLATDGVGNPLRAMPVVPANLFAWLGDSLTENGVALSGQNTGFSDYGWQIWADAQLGGAMKTVINAGVIGETTAQILARVSTVIASGCTYCTVLGGRNDINNGSITAATIKANLDAIYNALLTSGITVIAATIPPTFTGSGFVTASASQIEADVNDWIRRRAQSTSGMLLADFAAAIIDPTTSPGIAKSGMLRSTDNLHFAPRGARACGAALAAALSGRVKTANVLAVSATDCVGINASNNQQLDNPLLLATGSAVYPATNGYLNGSTNANIAAAWELLTSGSPSVTPSIVARSDGMGNSQRLAITSTTGSDQTNYRNRASIASRFVPGDVVRGQVKLSLSSAAALTGIKIWWSITVDGVTYSLHALNSSLYTFDQSSFVDYVFTTPDFVVPAGVLTSSYFTVRTTYSGAGGCTLDISQPTLRKLT